jgi:hypothetical protein
MRKTPFFGLIFSIVARWTSGDNRGKAYQPRQSEQKFKAEKDFFIYFAQLLAKL